MLRFLRSATPFCTAGLRKIAAAVFVLTAVFGGLDLQQGQTGRCDHPALFLLRSFFPGMTNFAGTTKIWSERFVIVKECLCKHFGR